MKTGIRKGADSIHADRAIELYSIREMIAYLDSCGDDVQVSITIESGKGGDADAGEEN
ncbi:MAG: hypothetical protein GX685_00115 [Clostridiales bacterium]|jgi:hypothetical protein|nr:hypothetical protein [Clostridiales bacterium]